jgi:hypothetical protein
MERKEKCGFKNFEYISQKMNEAVLGEG